MRSISEVPVEERVLHLQGRVSSATLGIIKDGLPLPVSSGVEIIFVSYAYADIPLTERFNVVFPVERLADKSDCDCRVSAVTQQFGKPFSEIPHGWKTICLFQFFGKVPDIILKLPIRDVWDDNRDAVCLCNQDTWEALVLRQKTSRW